MTELDILKAEHELLNDILPNVWESGSAEEKGEIAVYACGALDMTYQLLKLVGGGKE